MAAIVSTEGALLKGTAGSEFCVLFSRFLLHCTCCTVSILVLGQFSFRPECECPLQGGSRLRSKVRAKVGHHHEARQHTPLFGVAGDQREWLQGCHTPELQVVTSMQTFSVLCNFILLVRVCHVAVAMELDELGYKIKIIFSVLQFTAISLCDSSK